MSIDIDKFQVSIVNSGETTARDVQASYSVSISDGNGKAAMWHQSKVDQIGDMKAGSDPVVLSIEIFQGLDDKHLELIHDQKAILRFKGTVRYRDAYAPDQRLTGFDFYWKIDCETVDFGDGRTAYPDISDWEHSSEPGGNYQT